MRRIEWYVSKGLHWRLPKVLTGRLMDWAGVVMLREGWYLSLYFGPYRLDVDVWGAE